MRELIEEARECIGPRDVLEAIACVLCSWAFFVLAFAL